MSKAWVLLIGLMCVTCTSLTAQGVINFTHFVCEFMNTDAHDVAIGDLNGDGLPDAAVCMGSGGTPDNNYQVRVYLQQPPNGVQYSTQYPFPGPADPRAIAIGDVDNDGLSDIVLAFGDSVGVYHQNTGHTFNPVMTMHSGQIVDALTLGDVNNDGLLDIVSAHMYDAFIRVFVQIGGGFTQYTYPHPDAGKNELNIADVTGDGLADVVLMPGQFSSALYLFKQNSLGALDPYVSVPAGFGGDLYSGSAIGDLNGDGLNDVVASLGFSQALNIWYQNDTTHALQNTTQVQVNDHADATELADMDCDGNLDILVMEAGGIACYQADTAHHFGPHTYFQIPYEDFHDPQAFAIGDLNNDGRPDIITATYQGVSLLYNKTMPIALDSVVTHVVVDTTYTQLTTLYNSFFINSQDTVGTYVITTWAEYEVQTQAWLDSVRTDSLVLSYGVLCGGPVVDSAYSSVKLLQMDTLGSDTVLIYSVVDTLWLTIGEGAQLQWMNTFPDPTDRFSSIGTASDQAWLGQPYTLLDASGRTVGAGCVTELPMTLDLGGNAPGLYQLRLSASGRIYLAHIILLR